MSTPPAPHTKPQGKTPNLARRPLDQRPRTKAKQGPPRARRKPESSPDRHSRRSKRLWEGGGGNRTHWMKRHSGPGGRANRVRRRLDTAADSTAAWRSGFGLPGSPVARIWRPTSCTPAAGAASASPSFSPSPDVGGGYGLANWLGAGAE
ncbi:hypothetical protein NL676_030048 [Syzygium grande]|nr:hypothetical protein NL676_030048 [Syzygium grande]